MENKWYAVYALILGIVSFFTGELVTFIMLGFILMALININTTLKRNAERTAASPMQNPLSQDGGDGP
ncbi:hypothetical protein [Sporosarcina trichiuri]|uniref:hypothetical protein n=1 Tax=Sporosarcina trichiuri TaxID=3056445 RepID=UPI0025B2D4CD|nr:hypothetical protein [Sporosarcina sp. 0.2-SM1T-5]WJY27318.1 hypothetical protein QWT68_14950 [Sporosarcina sp. 0.2-SM1T-5]